VPKGETKRITLAMFKAGQLVVDIARERNLSVGTIETHLDSFIPTGEIHAKELVEHTKYDKVLEIINQNPDKTNTEIKEMLGDDYSWAEIRSVRNQFKLTEVG
jgi:uncharacterized protein YpbB